LVCDEVELMPLPVPDQTTAIFWAMVPGFNVYASTRATILKSQSDSSYQDWKFVWEGTNGPYVLTRLRCTSSPGTGITFGAFVRVTVDGTVFQFTMAGSTEEELEAVENFLEFPVIAKSSMKIEMKKRGSQAPTARAYAYVDRIVTQ
jgi:hypothetical protein